MGCDGPAAWMLFLEDLTAGLSRTCWKQRSGEQHSRGSVFSTARGCRSRRPWFGTCRRCPGAAQHSQVRSVHVLADSLCLTWPQGSVLSLSPFSRENTLPRWAQQRCGICISCFVVIFLLHHPSIHQVLIFFYSMDVASGTMGTDDF